MQRELQKPALSSDKEGAGRSSGLVGRMIDRKERERLILDYRQAMKGYPSNKVFDADDFFESVGFKGSFQERNEIMGEALGVSPENRNFYREEEQPRENKVHSRGGLLEIWKVQEWAGVIEKFDKAVEKGMTPEGIDPFFDENFVPKDADLRKRLLLVHRGITWSHTDFKPMSPEQEYSFEKEKFGLSKQRVDT